jgi:hypothetical protein
MIAPTGEAPPFLRAPELCLRLHGVRGWGRDGLGTGSRGRGSEGAEALMLPSLLRGEVTSALVRPGHLPVDGGSVPA